MFHGLDHLLGNTYFALFALAALLCSAGILLSKHPLNAAIYLIGVMLSVSGIYALLGSPFLGVIQVLVYAGAIMMLVVFVIMVLNRARDHEVPLFDLWAIPSAILPLLLLAAALPVLARVPAPTDAKPVRGEIDAIAPTMFRIGDGHGYWLLFEIVGVLLLVAIVAAVLLAKRKLDSPAHVAGVADAGNQHQKHEEPAHGAH